MAYTTIDDPTIYFNTVLYTGNTTQRSITGVGFQPDLVWFKNRSTTQPHCLVDAVKGVNNSLASNTTGAVDTDANDLQAFQSDGFQIGTNNRVNGNGNSMVAWCWKESPTAGFDILTFTGNASGNQTISHNLSAVPKWWNIKRLDQASNWCTYHVGLGGADHNVFLNTTSSSQTDTTIWNNTLPTSSVFSVGNNIDANGNGASHIWYGWTDKQGFSKFGSYKGNGNADGTFVYTGFRPAWVMIKRTDGTNSWVIYDNKREGFNVDNDALQANGNNAEGTSDDLDFLSNGFKMRTSGVGENGSGNSYIFIAFAESPFVNSSKVPNNAR